MCTWSGYQKNPTNYPRKYPHRILSKQILHCQLPNSGIRCSLIYSKESSIASGSRAITPYSKIAQRNFHFTGGKIPSDLYCMHSTGEWCFTPSLSKTTKEVFSIYLFFSIYSWAHSWRNKNCSLRPALRERREQDNHRCLLNVKRIYMEKTSLVVFDGLGVTHHSPVM